MGLYKTELIDRAPHPAAAAANMERGDRRLGPLVQQHQASTRRSNYQPPIEFEQRYHQTSHRRAQVA